MKNVIATTIILIAVSTASAAPVLTWNMTAVGPYDVYTMGVEGDLGPAGWYLDAVFTATDGLFNQEMFNVTVHEDTLSDATTYDGILGYVKATDTWYYDDHFCECAPNLIDIQGTSVITISSLGSIAADLFESADMIQFVVTSGTTINWVGVLSYDGADTPVEGSIPEPITLALLVMGSAGIVTRRRRAASFRKER